MMNRVEGFVVVCHRPLLFFAMKRMKFGDGGIEAERLGCTIAYDSCTLYSAGPVFRDIIEFSPFAKRRNRKNHADLNK